MDWLFLITIFILGLFTLDVLKMFFNHRERMAQIKKKENEKTSVAN